MEMAGASCRNYNRGRAPSGQKKPAPINNQNEPAHCQNDRPPPNSSVSLRGDFLQGDRRVIIRDAGQVPDSLH